MKVLVEPKVEKETKYGGKPLNWPVGAYEYKGHIIIRTGGHQVCWDTLRQEFQSLADDFNVRNDVYRKLPNGSRITITV